MLSNLCFLVQLLDACVNNCGKTFQLEVASRDFDSELKKLVAKWQSGDKVGDRIRNLIKKWSDAEFKADAQLSLMTSLYSRLRQEGIDFSTQSEPLPKVLFITNNFFVFTSNLFLNIPS